MEKEKIFMNSSGQTLPPSLNWHSSSGMEGQLEEINCNSSQFLNINWENSMDQSAPFESAMSSFVSSPATVSNSTVPADSAVMGELIGRLSGLCNNGRELSQSQVVSTNSTDTSCYSTPLNSPPELELLMMDQQLRGNIAATGNSMASSFAPFAADPEFAERAAKFSCYGSSNIGGLMDQFFLMGTESGNQLGISNNQSLKTGPQMGSLEIKDATTTHNILDAEMRPASSGSAPDRKFRRFSRSSTPDDPESSNARVEAIAAVLEPSSKGLNQVNARKRKTKAKEPLSSQVVADDNSNEKRCKAAEVVEAGKDVVKVKNEQSNDSNAGSGGKNQNKDSKPPEPPKQDYIHVRARRGQATDSHSLAERLRREKINERMKFLQDLVPGCNKVIGKAVMLDEIINYVQSLQRQVEFLSMKLAHVNPRLDFNVEALLSKDILQSRGSLPQTLYPLDSSAAASMFSYGHPPPQMPLQTIGSNGLETGNLLDATVRRDMGTQLPAIEGHRNFSSQLATLWEDDLNGAISSTHRY